jgi:hypothetical protein
MSHRRLFSSARLRIAIIALALSPGLSLNHDRAFAQGVGAIFGIYQDPDGFFGAYAEAQLLAPPISGNQQIGTPIGTVTPCPNPGCGFFEAGTVKLCLFGTCANTYPYTSWVDANGLYGCMTAWWRPLAPGGWYGYASYHCGYGYWCSDHCSGSSCSNLHIQQLGIETPFAVSASGGESIPFFTPIGEVNTRWNEHLWVNNLWYVYNYSAQINDYWPWGGTLSAPYPPYAWTAEY